MTDTFQELIAEPPQTQPAVTSDTASAAASSSPTAEVAKTASDNLSDAVKAAQAVVAPEAKEAVQQQSSDSETALRTLADMGITPLTAPQLVATAKNAENLVQLMRQNPAGFVA